MKVWVVQNSLRPATGYSLYDVYASREAVIAHLTNVNWSEDTETYLGGYGAPYHYVADEMDVHE